MTAIALLVALLLERFFDFGHIRIWRWYSVYLKTLAQKVPLRQPFVLLCIAVAPFVLVTGFLHVMLYGALFGFPLLAFNVLVLVACMGPQDLWADAFKCITKLEEADLNYASDSLYSAFGVGKEGTEQAAHQAFLQRIILEANWRVLGVAFWFFILGPMGAVLYRLVSLAAVSLTARVEPVEEIVGDAKQLEAFLDWIPVKFFTLLFALGGQFTSVFDIWRKHMKDGPDSNDALLLSCGMAALGFKEDDTIPMDGTVERSALSLMDRTLVIYLVLVGLLVFVF